MDVHATPDAQQNLDQPVQSQPVQSHQDVLQVIAEVERQLGRLRDVESRQAQEAEQLRGRLQAELEAQLEARMRQLAGREEALHAGEALLLARESQLQAMAESLRGEKANLARFAAESEALSSALNAREAAIESQRHSLAEELERCRCERAGLESLREEWARHEQRFTEESASLRGIADGARRELDSMRERCADLESSLAARDHVFEQKSGEVDALRAELASMAETVVAAEARSSGLAAENDRLRGEISAIRAEVSASTQAQMESVRAELAARLAASEGTVDALRKQLEVAERERATVTARMHQGVEAIDAERRAFDKALEAKRLALADVGVFLKQRKERIERARKLHKSFVRAERAKIRAATEAATVRVHEEERLVKKEREDLRQVQEMLAIAEQSMLRRSARHRASVTVAWCAMAAALVAVASWFAAGAALPPPSVASVDLVAKGGEGQVDSPDIDTAFQSVYREALRDKLFRSAVQKRLQERGVVALGSPEEMGRWMDSIRIDSDGPGTLRLVAEASDPETAVLALDTVATSLVNEAPKLAKGRAVPKVVLSGNSNQPGRMTFSQLVPQTGPGDRLLAAGLIFSGVVTVCGVIGLILFGRLSKAKQSFEAQEPA